MKLIIAGSRSLSPSFGFITNAIGMLGITNISEVVSGTAVGVDQEGEHWASHMSVSVKRFPAEWDKYGKRAGPIRNSKMAVYADCLLLIWDGSSSGSSHMKSAMIEMGKPVYEVILRRQNV